MADGAPTLDLGNLLVHLRADIMQYMASMKTIEATMQLTAIKMQRLGTQMSLALTLPIATVATLGVKAFSGFDDAMTKSLAIMQGVTPQLRQEMEDLATELSINGVTSATKLAESYFFLASAGLNAEQSMAALAAVERFAVAGSFDMAQATDLATDAQSALGLTVKDSQKNLENLIRVTDVLVGANTLANATTQQFSLALTSGAGPAMKAFNIPLEQGVAVLAAYADQGIKGANAGNLFSRMIRLMTKGFIKNRDAWDAFGLNIFDSAGELKDMAVIVNDLSRVLGTLSTQQKVVALDMLGFKARSQQAILPLIGLQDKVKGFNQELLNLGGTTLKVANKNITSFAAQMAIVKNNVAAMGRVIGDLIAPRLEDLGNRIKTITLIFTGLDAELQSTIVNTALVVAAIGPLLLVGSALIKVVLGLKAALVLLAAHPIVAGLVLLTAGVIKLTGGFGLMEKKLKTLRDQGKETFEDITQAANKSKLELDALGIDVDAFKDPLTNFGTGGVVTGLSVSGLQIGSEQIFKSVLEKSLEEQRMQNEILKRIEANAQKQKDAVKDALPLEPIRFDRIESIQNSPFVTSESSPESLQAIADSSLTQQKLTVTILEDIKTNTEWE